MAKKTKKTIDDDKIEIGELTINELVVSDSNDLSKLQKLLLKAGIRTKKIKKVAPKKDESKKSSPKKSAGKTKKEKPKKEVKPVKRKHVEAKPTKQVAKVKPTKQVVKQHVKSAETKPVLDKPTKITVSSAPKKVDNNEKIEIAIKEIEINQTTEADFQNKYSNLELPPITETGIKALKQVQKRQKQLTSRYSKDILDGKIISTTNYKPNVNQHVIELNDVTKSYLTGDIETQVLKGINIKLDKSDFIVILGPSGSGKTTFLNTISGLDKATKGDVFVLGYNLTLLKDSHLTKFRRKHVGFIFQQYNLLTNLTAKENAEVGENLAENKNADMSIEEIFETIGMKDQMNKYPHQMSGGQQQRVSIARALAKNPDLLFADEPTGALDEEMGRKVLQILVTVNKKYKTTIVVVTHNPNIAKIGNTVIHIKNGLIDKVIKNEHPADPATID
jgi:putative ABC transport system ATP-binding protein